MLIPQVVIGSLSEIIPNFETHASIDSLFCYANAPGDPPIGNKQVKTQEWLRRVNKTDGIDRLAVLGRIVEKYLEEDTSAGGEEWVGSRIERNRKISEALKRGGLHYVGNAIVTKIDSNQMRSLQKEVDLMNVESVEYEFKRAIENVVKDPYEAVSASCNILEAIFKVILEERKMEIPKTQDLQGLWKVVKKELGFDSTRVEDSDLVQILTGLSAIIGGTAALRTHASSAHGRGPFRYHLEERHVLLAVHAAHSVALFVIQTWKDKRTATGSG
jgi:hypothetical protein